MMQIHVEAVGALTLDEWRAGVGPMIDPGAWVQLQRDRMREAVREIMRQVVREALQVVMQSARWFHCHARPRREQLPRGQISGVRLEQLPRAGGRRDRARLTRRRWLVSLRADA